MVLPARCYSTTVFLSEPLWGSHRPGGFTAAEKNVGPEGMQEDGGGRPVPGITLGSSSVFSS